jgi:dTDP-4-amino-4,6-dideoxygalactose transaminase
MAKLAIKGGRPVRRKPFVSWPVFDKREERELLEVLRSGKWGIGGTKNEEFASKFAAYHQAEFGVTCSSGTAGLEIALKAVGVRYGDEVIVPPYTFIATAGCVLSLGAIPVFVDIDPKTYNIDPNLLEGAITPKTKAIIPVHIGGGPAHMDSIMKIANEHNIYVIEDACQAHGAEWRGHKVGAIGHMGVFSFQSSKNISAGEGGIVVTNDEELADRAWSYMNVGRSRKGEWYGHEVLGGNYRMTEFQAGLLLAQLNRNERLMRRRERNAAYLARKLHDVGGVEHVGAYPEVTRHAYHLFIMRYDKSQFNGLERDRFVEAIRAEGIPLSSGYATGPLYRLRAIAGYKIPGIETDYSKLFLPAAERACREEGMWLHQSVLLGSRKDMDDIIDAFLKVKENASELV